MPGLVRKLLVVAAVDGLILQPRTQHQQRAPAQPLRVDYATGAITKIATFEQIADYDHVQKLEAHGIVGVLNVSKYSYLIAINGRKHVAQIWGKPVYQITDVALVPISSQKDAIAAITLAKQNKKLENSSTPDQAAVADLVDDADDDAFHSFEDTWLDDHAETQHISTRSRTLQPPAEHAASGGVAQDVIGRKGVYGRFAERWFSQRGWTSGQQRNMGMSSHDSLSSLKSPPTSRRASSAASHQTATSPSPTRNQAGSPFASPTIKPADLGNPLQSSSRANDIRKTVDTIVPKLLQTLKLLLISNMFYFAYDFDITRRCAKQPSSGSDLPLHKRCDPRYVWNGHLLSPLVEEGFDEYVLPVMQGFVGQRAFDMDQVPSRPETASEHTTDSSSGDPSSVASVTNTTEKNGKFPCLLTLISRRSIKRAGFRYMRRGIDNKGNVANSVETEQILASPSWEENHIHSFVQTRGSIPLFYSQTPYTFKPLPTFHGSPEANHRALKTHFTSLANEYGSVQAVSLVDRHGPELPIGQAYENQISSLNSSGGINGRPVNLEWFDFHAICRGMNFSNVSVLLCTLAPFLTTNNWTTIDPESSKRLTSQTGIIRANCMDCLDRTNVVQSAIAQHVLTLQLSAFLSPSQSRLTPSDSTISPKPPEALSSLWADNGDAISHSYTGTAALKGDFVRTRRRNLAGVLTDLTLTLNRYYRNLFDDFFAQAALDFALGNVGEQVFVEFREKMCTADVGVDLNKAREMAVAGAGRVVVEESEDLLAGWVVSTPAAVLDPAAPDGVMGTDAAKMNAAALRAQPFREVILLLSDVAVYAVTYDWDAEKVQGFERVALGSLRRLQRGAYVTRTLTARQRDVARNVGVLVEFEVGGGVATRVGSMGVGAEAGRGNGGGDSGGAGGDEERNGKKGRKVWAFKALGNEGSRSRGKEPDFETDEKAAIAQICDEIQKAFESDAKRRRGESRPTVPGQSATTERGSDDVHEKKTGAVAGTVLDVQSNQLSVEEKTIVSVQEAQKGTTVMEQVEYGLKRLVWG